MVDFPIPGLKDTKIDKMIINPVNPRINITWGGKYNNKMHNKYIVGTNEKNEKIIFHMDSGSWDEESKTYKEAYRMTPSDYEGRELISDFTIKELYELEGDLEFQIYENSVERNIFGKYKEDKDGKPISHTDKLGDSFVISF